MGRWRSYTQFQPFPYATQQQRLHLRPDGGGACSPYRCHRSAGRFAAAGTGRSSTRPARGASVSARADCAPPLERSKKSSRKTDEAPRRWIRHHLALLALAVWRLVNNETHQPKPSPRAIVRGFVHLMGLHILDHWTVGDGDRNHPRDTSFAAWPQERRRRADQKWCAEAARALADGSCRGRPSPCRLSPRRALRPRSWKCGPWPDQVIDRTRRNALDLGFLDHRLGAFSAMRRGSREPGKSLPVRSFGIGSLRAPALPQTVIDGATRPVD